MEQISGDRRWLSLSNAVLETGVAQICHEGFSITVADADICLAALQLHCFKHKFIVRVKTPQQEASILTQLLKYKRVDINYLFKSYQMFADIHIMLSCFMYTLSS